MECDEVRVLLSEALEGEGLADDAREHVERCPDCLEFEASIERVRRSLRFEELTDVPDVSGDVLAALDQRRRRHRLLPSLVAALAVLGVVSAGTLAATRRPRSPAVEVTRIGPDVRPTPSGDGGVLLAWSPSPMSAEAVTTLATRPGVRAATVASVGSAELVRPLDGEPVSIEVLAVDPETFPDLVDDRTSELVAALAPDVALLSEGSATLRGLMSGDLINLDGRELTISAVVPDSDLRGAEVAVSSETAMLLELEATPYVLMGYDGDSHDLAAEVQTTLDTTSVRVLQSSSTASLSSGGLVPSQLQVRQRYGDATLAAANIADGEAPLVRREVALLGPVTCHQVMIQALDAAMRELRSRGADAPTPGACYAPAATGAVDRHPWGIAIDLNPELVDGGEQDATLVEVMKRWGFAWGGDLFVPEPAYFEYVEPPPDANLPDIELTELAERLDLVDVSAEIRPVHGGQIIVVQRAAADGREGGQVVITSGPLAGAERLADEPASDAWGEPIDIAVGGRPATIAPLAEGRQLDFRLGERHLRLVTAGDVTDDELVAIAERLVLGAVVSTVELPQPPDGFRVLVDTETTRGLRLERHYDHLVDGGSRPHGTAHAHRHQPRRRPARRAGAGLGVARAPRPSRDGGRLGASGRDPTRSRPPDDRGQRRPRHG